MATRFRRQGRPGSIVVAATVLGVAAVACGYDSGGSVPVIDAGAPPDARRAIDATPEPDRIDPLLWVQFSAAGCERGGADQDPCEGAAPLSVTFSAAAPAAIDTYLWDFGDGTPTATEPRPAHVFDRPGTYDVSLTVGGPGGTASSLRVGFAVVAAAPVGAVCSVDAQCEEGLSCFCGEQASCPPALAAGICSRNCSAADACPEGSSCINLPDPTPAPVSGGVCLATCDRPCRDGFACRELPSVPGDESGEPGDPPAPRWGEVCFTPGLFADTGAACYDGASNPVDAACAGGVCAPVGARGQCTSACETTADCPSDAACATFNAGGSRCVARCSDSADCPADPWLDCTAPGAAGDLGFSVDENTPIEAGYCAPRPCAEIDDCPGGACVDGHCGPAE